LVREIAQHSLRIQKTLEDANLKLGSVLSNILGKSGRAILGALIAGERDPERLADLAQGNARKKRAELVEALHGRISTHHRSLTLRISGSITFASDTRNRSLLTEFHEPYRNYSSWTSDINSEGTP